MCFHTPRLLMCQGQRHQRHDLLFLHQDVQRCQQSLRFKSCRLRNIRRCCCKSLMLRNDLSFGTQTLATVHIFFKASKQ